jgi:outer membrane protein assembly factor BamD
MKLTPLILIAVIALSACSSSDKIDPSTPQGAYELAEQYEKDERYEEAIQKFTDVKNKHPYSKYAVESELKIADLQYTREAYIEAQNAYQLFKDFHPKHPRIDYVTYRLAMSYYMQLPSTIDRDLSLSDKTILYFDEVMRSYPTSQYVAEAVDKKANVLRMLSEKELYVATFYFKREMYDSALGRYESILKTYPKSADVPYALFGAAYSADKISQPDKAERYFDELKERFSDSSEYRRAQRELKAYAK